ncbi:bacillithiol biosynthesis deacetylase BshB1 [Candidatus Hydrogenedentota bacterium]
MADNTTETASLDLLAFGAHPDDIEIAAGGTVIALSSQGYLIGVVDITAGEMGTRGDVETRASECAAASKLLGIVCRENLGLPDGDIQSNKESRREVIDVIRKYRPSVVLGPWRESRHSDHGRAHRLIVESAFEAGLSKLDAPGNPYRPPGVIFYQDHRFDQVPNFVVDISETFKAKMSAIRAYRSQFSADSEYGPQTYLTRKTFLGELLARNRFLGSQIGARYGEGFIVEGPLPVRDPLALWRTE